MPTCSLILDARTSGAALPRRLAALRALDVSGNMRLERLLVDDTQDPRLPALARRHGVRRIAAQGTPLGDRLNRAVSHGQGDLLCFPSPARNLSAAWLTRALASLADHEQDAVILASHPGGRLRWLWPRWRHGEVRDTLCLSRRWFERIGGCDPSLDEEAISDLLERLHACQARVDSQAA
jgi:hypothetical protein